MNYYNHKEKPHSMAKAYLWRPGQRPHGKNTA